MNKTKNDVRVEKDSMGEMRVPRSAYYGPQTQRAVENFPISGRRFSRRFLRALGMIKLAAAEVNHDLELVDGQMAEAIGAAAREVMNGQLDEHFVLDIFQTGSGTSTNMNANEVISNRASELLGSGIGSKRVHPNDDVNRCQSSNDVIPTAIHVAAVEGLDRDLIPALEELHAALASKAEAFDKIVKIGRTHLQDATPVRLGQEFSGYARQLELGIQRLEAVQGRLCELALGGTAVGTGLNTHPEFASRVIQKLGSMTSLPFVEAANHFEAQGAQDSLVECSGALRTVAVGLMKIANDIRWLGSGPRCGLGELRLPAVQPGSSIMPGKVNPVITESVIQVAAQVQGNDLTVALGGQWGCFELNTMLPVMASNLLESIEILSTSCSMFAERCIQALEVDEAKATSLIEGSLAMVTALVPAIGYDKAAEIAKQAYESGRTVRELAVEQQLLPLDELERVLDPLRMTEPGIP